MALVQKTDRQKTVGQKNLKIHFIFRTNFIVKTLKSWFIFLLPKIHSIFRTNNIDLPPPGQYATGILFLSHESYKQAKESFSDLARGNKIQFFNKKFLHKQ